MEFEVSTRDITTFKNKWKKQHEVKTYTDEMSPNENEMFKNDEVLIRLIKRCKEAEQNVLDHMDQKIELSRSE
jgi:hypothetical protein